MRERILYKNSIIRNSVISSAFTEPFSDFDVNMASMTSIQPPSNLFYTPLYVCRFFILNLNFRDADRLYEKTIFFLQKLCSNLYKMRFSSTQKLPSPDSPLECRFYFRLCLHMSSMEFKEPMNLRVIYDSIRKISDQKC